MEEQARTHSGARRTAYRWIVGAAASVGMLIAASIVVAPAGAATPPPAFEIFYGLNCSAGTTASRVYTGLNSSEEWINDTFDSKRWGSAGFGQKIRYNAASIYVSYATVGINWNRNDTIGWRSAGACFNLGYMRNNNVNWAVVPF